MPRAISPELKTHLMGDNLTIAYCISLVCNNGTSYYFTTHSDDLLYDELIYSSNGSVKISAIYSSNELASNNLEISLLRTCLKFSDAELIDGALSDAKVEVFITNYTNTSEGKMILFTGHISEFSFNSNKIIAQVKGLSRNFSYNIGSMYSANCRANFCDKKCKLDIKNFAQEFKITKVHNRSQFIISPQIDNDLFERGTIEFLNGLNSGQKFQIQTLFNSNVTLLNSPQRNIAKNTKIIVRASCDKSFNTCVNKYKNAINFRGEPHLAKLNN